MHVVALDGASPARTSRAVAAVPVWPVGTLYQAADLARPLHLPEISVIEFGVAGGRGLIELERLAAVIGRHFSVDIVVIGYDSGQGMPEPEDYRGLPYYWGSGYYRMDIEACARSWTAPFFVLGDVRETAAEFSGPPIGFIAFDLDYHSSTKGAFRIFGTSAANRLPRIFGYFDDIMSELGCHNEFIGELCAIREFNNETADQKIAPLYGLESMTAHPTPWQKRIYVHHDFRHPLYCPEHHTSR